MRALLVATPVLFFKAWPVAVCQGKGDGMKEEWIAYIVKQTLQGLKYFHDQGQVIVCFYPSSVSVALFRVWLGPADSIGCRYIVPLHRKSVVSAVLVSLLPRSIVRSRFSQTVSCCWCWAAEYEPLGNFTTFFARVLSLRSFLFGRTDFVSRAHLPDSSRHQGRQHPFGRGWAREAS